MKFWLSTCWVGEGFLSCGTCLCPLGNDGGTMQPCYKWTRKGISTQISPEEMLSVAVKYTHSLWVGDKSSLGRRTFEEERGGGIHVSQPGSDTRLSSHVPEHSTFDGAPFPLQPPSSGAWQPFSTVLHWPRSPSQEVNESIFQLKWNFSKGPAHPKKRNLSSWQSCLARICLCS